MIDFLQKYLSINTALPDPRYDEAIKLFAKQAILDGFLVNEIVLKDSFKVLVITALGTEPALPALLLNHHMDVVPAPDVTSWYQDPFTPLIKDGYIYARGTQDMKGIGVLHYFALRELKLAGITLKRTVHIALVPDEECGGYNGAHLFVETDFFKQMNVGYALDEGWPSGKDSTLGIKITERKPIQVLITSKGEMSHGSRLACVNASHLLINFLHELIVGQAERQNKLAHTPAGLLLSFNITSLHAGVVVDGQVTLNVVSDTATATADIRVPPFMSMEAVHQQLQLMMQQYPGITYEVRSTVEERIYEQFVETSMYRALVESIEDQGLSVDKIYMEGSTDLRFYQAKGIEGFGISPFTVEANLHGINECVSLKDLETGKQLFIAFIKKFCL